MNKSRLLIIYLLLGLSSISNLKCIAQVERIIMQREINLDNYVGNPFIEEFSYRLFTLIEEGVIDAFADPDRTKKLSLEEWAFIGAWAETVEVPNDPEDPDTDYHDSTFYNPQDPYVIKDYVIYEQLLYDKKKHIYEVENLALAALYHEVMDGVSHGNKIWFWIDYSDLNKFLFDYEIELINYTVHRSLIDTFELNEDDYLANLKIKENPAPNLEVNPDKENIISSGINLDYHLGKPFIQKIHYRMYKLVQQGIIPAYSDNNFTKIYSIEELDSIGRKEFTWEYAPDPIYPDYMVDTTAYEACTSNEISIQMASLLWNHDKSFEKYNGNNTGLAIFYDDPIDGDVLKKELYFWINYKDISKFLTDSELNFLKYAVFRGTLDNICNYCEEGENEYNSPEEVYSSLLNMEGNYIVSRNVNLSKHLGKDFVQTLNNKIHEAAIKGEITAFKNDSFTSSYTMQEVLLRGAQEVVFDYPDPDDPENNDYSDSTYYLPFDTYYISGNYVADQWSFESKKDEFSANIYGFSLNYNLIIEGQNLGVQPLFYITYDDLKNFIDPKKLNEFHEAVYKELLNKLSNPDDISLSK